MALPTGIRNRVNAFITNFTSMLGTRQDAYKAANGKFWQGLPTQDRSNPPDGNTDQTPDVSRKPTDQTADWSAMITGLPAKWPASLEVVTYSGPLGDGFRLIARVKGDGSNTEVWQKIVN